MNSMLEESHQVLEALLREHVSRDNCQHELQITPDQDYERLYTFFFTPCCFPLRGLAWINPVSHGVFLRCFYPEVKDPQIMGQVLALLSSLNWQIPSGCYAANPETGEVVFKNAVFVYERAMDEHLVRSLIESSFEIVSVHWEHVLQAIFGTDSNVHNHHD